MDYNHMSLKQLLQHVQNHDLSIDEAQQLLRQYDELGFAKVDLHRQQRQGFPEVIYGAGKTKEQIGDIIQTLLAHHHTILVTRVIPEKATAILRRFPELQYHETAQILSSPLPENIASEQHFIAILCAGTSDLPVAEEAAITAELMGIKVKRFYDVGVSGIHRLFTHIEDIRQSTASVVIAGMEGALASVVGGLVDHPVFAVPTSVGYGANLDGITTLLSMLNSCAPGTSVLNIDNGFGGGYNAAMIVKMLKNHSDERR